jgi:hypothetical protein
LGDQVEMWGVSLFCTKGVFVSIYIWIPFLGLFVDTEKFFFLKKIKLSSGSDHGYISSSRMYNRK